MISKNKLRKIFQDLNNEILEELIPKDMVVPILRLKFSIQNLSWLCRNLQIRNNEHPEIKQTMAKLNTFRMKILLGRNVALYDRRDPDSVNGNGVKDERVSEPPVYPLSLGDLHI